MPDLCPLSRLNRVRPNRTVWAALLIAVGGCNCGVRTSLTTNGITLVTPKGTTDTRTIDFGVVRVSQVASQPIVLRNDSRSSWTILTMALSADSSKNLFLKLPAGPLPTLAPGQTYNAELRYQPSRIGSDVGTVNITTNSPSTPKYIINVKGNGGASKIDVCSQDDSGKEVCAQEQPDGKLVIDLGKVKPGSSSTKPLVVKSLGTLPLNLSSVEMTAMTPPDYSLALGMLPTSIPTQKTTNYSVTFKPTVGGEEDGSIEFDSDDPATPRLIVYLKAVGDAPRLCVQPTSVEFGDVDLGSTATQALQLTSCGTEPITVQSVNITDNGSGSPSGSPVLFGEASPPMLPQTLDAGQSMTVNMTFTPVAFGDANGKVLVATADGERGIVPMHGRGVGCQLTGQPSPVNFGQVPNGGHASSNVTISNTGTGMCNITSFAIEGGQGSPFALTMPPTTPVMLNPGQSQTVTVTFSPTAVSSVSDNLVVTGNTAMPLKVPLKGQGITPPPCVLVPDPSSLVFSNVSAGQTATQYVTLTNEGTTDCYVTYVVLNSVMGASTADFTATLVGSAAMGPANFAPVDVPASMNVKVKVDYKPTSATSEQADLQVDYNTQAIPEFPPILGAPYHVHIPITGGELPPCIHVMPSSLDFGSVAAGGMKTMSFNIISACPGTLWVRGLRMQPGSSPYFTFANAVHLPQYLPSQATLAVSVTYSPVNGLGDFGEVAVMSNDPNTPKALVPLRGNVSNVCAKQLACSVSQLVFPTMQIGDTAPMSLTCQNVGSQPVTVTGVSFSSQSSGAFSAPPWPPQGQTIQPGDFVRIEIDYTPQQAGTDTGTVTVESDACETISANLQGAGIVDNLPPCPPPQVFSPQVKWNWTGSGATQPSSDNVAMSPVVVNLEDTNHDGRVDVNDVPDVLFTTCSLAQCCLNCLNVMDFSTADFSGIGMLRAVHGDTGKSYFDITDPSLELPAVTQLATADLDGDNLPEIVAVQHTFHKGSGTAGMQGKYLAGDLLVFDHTGKLEFVTDQWTGDPNSFEFGSAPAIADLDGDGKPEIVFERTVFNYDGTKRFDMSKSGNWGHGAFPTISDVDGDGHPEIVSGNLVYKADGTLLWTAPSGLGAGPTMVLDINGDGKPEVILRDGAESVHVLDGATGAIIAQASWPPPQSSSNDPTQSDNGICPAAMSAADLDGDGHPELIIPSGDFIYAWKYDGSTNLKEMWQQPINDYQGQCGASGSAAFDFEGQGRYDVVYHDTQYLYVFRGIDGTLVYQTPRSSDTIFETPVIADVDNDGHADILMTNDGGGGTITGTLAGVVALSNTGNTWPSARRIWSDHAYHVSEVTEGALVPRIENWSWKKGNNNNWRAQEPRCTP